MLQRRYSMRWLKLCALISRNIWAAVQAGYGVHKQLAATVAAGGTVEKVRELSVKLCRGNHVLFHAALVFWLVLVGVIAWQV